MQPYLFPYLGYFQLMKAVDTFVIFDDVNYIKKGWINRNRILVDGKPFLFTMPLEKISQNKLICDARVSPSLPQWLDRFFEQLRHGYHRAQYYDHCIDVIRPLFYGEDRRLNVFLSLQMKELARHLGIDAELVYSSEILKNPDIKAQDKIIDICKRLGAKHYVNLPGGRELYQSDAFLENDLELLFVESSPIEYKQFDEAFVPNLSIIDVMMFNSREAISVLLEHYKLEGERHDIKSS